MARRLTATRKLSALALALAFAALSATSAVADARAAPPGPSEQIVGGTLDRYTNTKWVASLIRTDYDSHWCGGSLVARRWVLTAAHCTLHTRRWQWKVRLGSKRWQRGGVVRRVTRIFPYPHYRPKTKYGDVSVLKLSRPVPRRIDNISLVPSGTHYIRYNDAGAPTTVAYIAGWGALSEGGSSPYKLFSTFIWVLRDEECERQGIGYNRHVMMCAGAQGTDTCQGDSGGPLAVWNGSSWRLLGVTSFGDGCARDAGAYAWVGSPRLHRWLRYL